MDQMDNDLYFLKLGSNPVWKLMKLDLLDYQYYIKGKTDKATSSSTTVNRISEDQPAAPTSSKEKETNRILSHLHL